MPDDLAQPYTAPQVRRPVVPNGVLGMLIFVVTEVMFFAGMISAFMIVKSGALVGWPPPGQPRLPVEETLVNTVALLLSGVLLFVANSAYRKGKASTGRWLLASIVLGAFFVVFQGVEWVALINEGLTLTSSSHGSFFYLIVGTHALHAVVALGILMWVYRKLLRDELRAYAFWPPQIFWYFVVLMWPILYWRVYL